jgi:hypothetical protein
MCKPPLRGEIGARCEGGFVRHQEDIVAIFEGIAPREMFEQATWSSTNTSFIPPPLLHLRKAQAAPRPLSEYLLRAVLPVHAPNYPKTRLRPRLTKR